MVDSSSLVLTVPETFSFMETTVKTGHKIPSGYLQKF